MQSRGFEIPRDFMISAIAFLSNGTMVKSTKIAELSVYQSESGKKSDGLTTVKVFLVQLFSKNLILCINDSILLTKACNIP